MVSRPVVRSAPSFLLAGTAYRDDKTQEKNPEKVTRNWNAWFKELGASPTPRCLLDDS